MLTWMTMFPVSHLCSCLDIHERRPCGSSSSNHGVEVSAEAEREVLDVSPWFPSMSFLCAQPFLLYVWLRASTPADSPRRQHLNCDGARCEGGDKSYSKTSTFCRTCEFDGS
eukprot:gb/GECG01001620.1/.p1 GENE.gb/GECG01001620.1/~~gb/GECG01001620.1/.p1  ORF type:complete len:112 (+),score=3.77 gb/GECG01001620.1/:1-336(+)